MLLSKKSINVLFLAALSVTPLARAHTWIEQLMIIAPNGTMVGKPGFPRSNVQRTAPGFGDAAMVFLIPPNGGPANKIDANQLMCRPEQTTQRQTADSPRLKAAPGQAVALRYQENGHVTLPQNTPGKPKNSGANFVYFTTNSKPDDKFLQIHRQWTADGNGGDGRGRLISTQNFDDGQCYQINGQTISKQRQNEFQHEGDTLQGQSLWCQQDIQIPADAQPGSTITLYWVWDWPTLPGTAGFPQGKQEIYTTCMDIDIVASSGQIKAASQGFVKQDFAKAAVSAQFADIGNPTAVKAQLIPFSSGSAGSSSSLAQSTSSSTRTTSVSPTTARQSSSTSSATPSVVVIPGQLTVTVRETVTATITPSRTRRVSQSAAAATVTETKFVTVTVSSTPIKKREVAATTDSVNPYDSSTMHRVYQLRARHPLYVLSADDTPTSSAGTGC